MWGRGPLRPSTGLRDCFWDPIGGSESLLFRAPYSLQIHSAPITRAPALGLWAFVPGPLNELLGLLRDPRWRQVVRKCDV